MAIRGNADLRHFCIGIAFDKEAQAIVCTLNYATVSFKKKKRNIFLRLSLS